MEEQVKSPATEGAFGGGRGESEVPPEPPVFTEPGDGVAGAPVPGMGLDGEPEPEDVAEESRPGGLDSKAVAFCLGALVFLILFSFITSFAFTDRHARAEPDRASQDMVSLIGEAIAEAGQIRLDSSKQDAAAQSKSAEIADEPQEEAAAETAPEPGETAPPGERVPRYVAHQGDVGQSGKKNTLAAFDAAASVDGVWGIESDLQMTSDGQWVMLHGDDDGATWRGLDVSSSTLAELREADDMLPALDQFLSICRSHGKVAVLELKDGGIAWDDAQCRSVVDAVAMAEMLDDVVITAHRSRAAAAGKVKAYARSQYGVDVKAFTGTGDSRDLVDEGISLAKEHGLDGIGCYPKYGDAFAYAMERSAAEGLLMRSTGAGVADEDTALGYIEDGCWCVYTKFAPEGRVPEVVEPKVAQPGEYLASAALALAGYASNKPASAGPGPGPTLGYTERSYSSAHVSPPDRKYGGDWTVFNKVQSSVSYKPKHGACCDCFATVAVLWSGVDDGFNYNRYSQVQKQFDYMMASDKWERVGGKGKYYRVGSSELKPGDILVDKNREANPSYDHRHIFIYIGREMCQRKFPGTDAVLCEESYRNSWPRAGSASTRGGEWCVFRRTGVDFDPGHARYADVLPEERLRYLTGVSAGGGEDLQPGDVPSD